MMDLGLGSFVDKFEEYFGRAVTQALLILIGLAASAACLSVIWTWLITPLLIFFAMPLWGQSILSLLVVAFAIGIGIALSFLIISSVANVRRLRAANKIYQDAEKMFDRVEAQGRRQIEELRHDVSQAGDLFDKTLAILNAMLEARPGLSADDREKLVAAILKAGKDQGD